MNKVEQEIAALVHARSEALVKQDVDTLMRILHPDFVYTNAYGEKTSRTDYVGRFSNADMVMRWERQEISELEIQVHGATALVFCRVRDVVNWNNTHMDNAFRSTFVYLHTDEGWRCITGHTSPIVEE